jgi:hypothetical protein
LPCARQLVRIVGAPLFRWREVLKRDFGGLDDVVRATRPILGLEARATDGLN